ncbi:ROK family protein [Schaalia georgiae F0490]|uniref:ROK family protein n=1 Tax=Schaalia georgiae F0490 TaxID=1125717 RepID=J0MU20_9ACTO|nr:ROK family protein [Schaalia georgiae]EJF37789.1 ROK family protein [Schaalia georgiae F0490]
MSTDDRGGGAGNAPLRPAAPVPAAVGIDIGGTTVKSVLVGQDGSVLTAAGPCATPVGDVPALVGTVVGLVRDLDAGRGLPVGVCVPGIVDEAHGVGVLSANLGWRGAPLRRLLSDALGSPIALGHDVRCGALAESLWGVGEADMLYVAIGTGIASALIIDSRPCPAPAWAGEIGQIVVEDPDSPGRRTPLEQIASASAIARRAAEAGMIGPGAGAREAEERAQEPDGGPAAMVFASAMSLLGAQLGIVRHQVGDVPLVIGGGLSKGGPLVYDNLARGAASVTGRMPLPRIVPAALGPASQALGAAALALRGAHVPSAPTLH